MIWQIFVSCSCLNDIIFVCRNSSKYEKKNENFNSRFYDFHLSYNSKRKQRTELNVFTVSFIRTFFETLFSTLFMATLNNRPNAFTCQCWQWMDLSMLFQRNRKQLFPCVQKWKILFYKVVKYPIEKFSNNFSKLLKYKHKLNLRFEFDF